MQQPRRSDVDRQLLLKRPEHFRRDGLELETGLVDHSAPTFDAITALAPQFVREQPASLRQRVL